MEGGIAVIARFESADRARMMSAYFSRDERPVFAEDVTEEIRPAFILFEFVEPADQIEAHDCSLRLYWPVLSGDHQAWIKSLCKGLTLGGATDCAGMLVLDEDFSAGFSFKAGKLEMQPMAEPIYEYDAKKMFDKISRIYGAC